MRMSALNGVMQLAEELPDVRVSALALDENGAESALRTCLAHIADAAFLVHGFAVDVADTVGAAYLMADAIQTIEFTSGPFGLISCGDSDSGQDGLGPALAGCLDRPQVTGAVNAWLDGQHFVIQQQRDNELAQIRVESPCVVSFLCPSTPAHYPQLSRLMSANEAKLQVVQTAVVPPSWESVVYFEQPRTKQILAFNEKNAVSKLVELLQ